ncbi:LuxR C-terminal-related transcriptional regulator [Streptomyces hyaluromycini]|uniref:LuxR C-terminal-related transcriptional regulator n=1 Tax=Streptomyces hyaluromycini TaxID=1377993 RepID=UPI000B5D0561
MPPPRWCQIEPPSGAISQRPIFTNQSRTGASWSRFGGVAEHRPGQDTSTSALTVRQRQSAEPAAFGLSNKQIGERFFLSHHTVGSHLLRALKAISTLEEHIEAP